MKKRGMKENVKQIHEASKEHQQHNGKTKEKEQWIEEAMKIHGKKIEKAV